MHKNQQDVSHKQDTQKQPNEINTDERILHDLREVIAKLKQISAIYSGNGDVDMGDNAKHTDNLSKARAFLQDALANGPKDLDFLLQHPGRTGISDKELQIASEDLGLTMTFTGHFFNRKHQPRRFISLPKEM